MINANLSLISFPSLSWSVSVMLLFGVECWFSLPDENCLRRLSKHSIPSVSWQNLEIYLSSLAVMSASNMLLENRWFVQRYKSSSVFADSLCQWPRSFSNIWFFFTALYTIFCTPLISLGSSLYCWLPTRNIDYTAPFCMGMTSSEGF